VSEKSHKERVELGYDVDADRYDDDTSRRMISHLNILLRDLKIPESPTILDVGCGTGISTFEVMKRARREGRFYGIDISEKMIEKARKKAAEGGHTCFEFSKGDAEKLEFPDSKFDLVISNAVLHWVPNKLQALKEMHRVLKPNGMVALFFSGRDQQKESIPLIVVGMRLAESRGNYPQARSWYEYRSSFLTLEETDSLFDEAGFIDKNIYDIHRIRYVDPRQNLALHRLWRVGLPPDLLGSIQKAASEEALRLSSDKGFKLTYHYIVAYGRKSESH
jgi:ubiquinone/menaquinone biosynthesis C-methylase UbiE